MSSQDATPSVKQTPMSLVVDAILAMRLDVSKLGEAEVERRERDDRMLTMLETIQGQLAEVLAALQTIANEQLRQSQKCNANHPTVPDLRAVQ